MGPACRWTGLLQRQFDPDRAKHWALQAPELEPAAALLRATADGDLALLQTPHWMAEVAVRLDHHLFDTLHHAVALSSPDTVLITADRRYQDKAHGVGQRGWLPDLVCPQGAADRSPARRDSFAGLLGCHQQRMTQQVARRHPW